MTEEITPGNGLALKKQEHELERNKWRGRRMMARISLYSMIVLTFLILFGPIPDERLKILTEPITWFYFAMTSVIGAYMGFTTWASRGK